MYNADIKRRRKAWNSEKYWRKKRRELGLNQSQLADKLGAMGIPLSNQAISKWEKGTTLPNAKQFLTLCTALNIDDING
ncbi:protein containing Helix-turn-helix type 3 domain protein, partial [gut metagenome]